MKRIREQGPTFVTNPIIAVIVTDGSTRSVASAARYVAALPPQSHINAFCGFAGLALLQRAGKKHHLSVSRSDSPAAAIRHANLCMVFGHSPFSAHDASILREQGIAVEFQR